MRNLVVSILGAIALVSVAPIASHAETYPDGPGTSCPDSVTIFRIQNPSATCHPATLDTVLGIGGIITGFDAKPSGLGFYLQNRATVNAWTGIDIFTGSFNYNGPLPGTPSGGNLAVGDSVVVYGKTQEFQGETEVEGLDLTQGTNDVIIRKISSGNPLPPFVTGTTNTFSHLPTNPNGEQYEGMLVRVATSMRVARTSLTGGLPFNSFLLVNQVGSATDSVHVDGNTLTTFTPPSVGTTVVSVQGLWHQRTNSVSSFRIQLRDPSDINVQAPPNLINAFAIQDNVLRLTFDKDLTAATAQDEDNYSLTSLGNVDLATQISGSVVHLTITNGLSDGDLEGVTVVDVVSQSNGLQMTTPQTRSFVNGVIAPSVVQAPDPAALSGSPCEDRSRYAGPGSTIGSLPVSIEGVSVAQFGALYYVTGVAGGARNGVSVFIPIVPLTIGHKFLVVGNVQEFGSGPQNGRETEVVSTVYIEDRGVATAAAPIAQQVGVLADTTCDNSSPQGPSILTHLPTGEDYEGTLVMVERVKITENRLPGEGFFVAGPAPLYPDTILIANSNSSYTFAADSNQIVTIRGILASNSLSSRRFRIQPRSNGDIKIVTGAGVGEGDIAGISFAVTPNPARTARVAFAIPQEADVDLAVYDVVGRRIQTLAKGRLEAGQHSREWTGRLANGKLASSGMYFYRLTVGNETRTIRGIKLN